MNFDPIGNDPVTVDKQYPATLAPVTFESKGERLLGNILMAQGAGPYPIIILLHGFPGFERNFDLAQIFRRAGWNVLVFHYRGAWGSQGSFSFKHVLEDVSTALDFLRAKSSQELYRVDSGKIVLIGHSMGGSAALMTAVNDPHISAVASIAGVNPGIVASAIRDDQALIESVTHALEEDLSPLQGTTAESLVAELLEAGENWNLVKQTTALSQRSVLLIGGSRDQVAPVNIHYTPLVQALQNCNARDLTHLILDADHAFSDKRVALARTILSWLEKQFKD